ncbi:MAG: sugar phosphate nucleotidyltransferase [Kiritimatiellia bacterium]
MKIQAMILIGGLGTRLAALFPDRPKALVPVGERVFLDRQLEWLAGCGVSSVHLAAGHSAGRLREWLAKASLPMPVTISVEPAPLGTGGGLSFAASYIHADPFLALNGDSLLPQLDLPGMLVAHRRSGAAVTMSVAPVTDSGRYGLVDFDDDDRIIRAFREKAAASAGWVNGGVYLINRSVLADLPSAPPPFSLERDVFPDLVKDSRIQAWPTPPPLLDMGTPDGLQAMTDYFLSADCAG